MFSTAKSIGSKPTAAAKKTKEMVDVAGVRDIALLNALIKNATAMLETLETEVKATGFEHFMSLKGSTRPSSYVGQEGEATCSIEMRKRGTNSKLTDDEVEQLRAAGIEPFEQVVTQELFAINPKYAEDSTLLGKVEKALAGKVPEDFIVKQEGVTKFVVSDEMLDEAFKKSGTDEVLRTMTTMALKPKLSAEYDMANLLEDALAIMQPKKTAKVALPKSKKAA